MDESKKDFTTKLVITWGLVFLFMVALVLEMYIIFQNAPGTALNFSILIIEVFFGVGITVTVTLLASKENKSLKKLVTEQKEMLETMKPIIEKQGKIIEKQEEKERIERETLFNHINFYLTNSKTQLQTINQLRMKNESHILFPGELERQIITLETNREEISKNCKKLFSLEVMIPQKIGDAYAKIHIYTGKLRERERVAEEENAGLGPVPDPTKVIKKIDVALKELPEPGPA